MKLVIPKNEDDDPFRSAWPAALRRGGKKARIASLPELALARTTAPPPHAPGKVWETYIGNSPLWERWIMTNTAVFVGLSEGRPVLLVAHGLPLSETEARGEQARNRFHLSENVWTRLLEETPPRQILPLDTARRLGCECYAPLTGAQLLADPLAKAVFATSLEPYVKAHREIAFQYVVHWLRYRDMMRSLDAAGLDRIEDPPILEFNFDYLRQFQEEPPRRGATGWYLTFEGIMTMNLSDFRPAPTRSCQLDLVRPNDDAKFLVIVE